MTALLFSGIILSVTHAIQISVLGEDIYGRAVFPLLTTIGKVNLADFLQRMDIIAILTFFIGDFFKVAIFCYAAVIVASDLFKVPKLQRLVLPVGIIVLYSSMMLASNFPEHLQEGKLNLIFLLPLFSAVIPVLLLAVHLIRKRFGLYRP